MDEQERRGGPEATLAPPLRSLSVLLAALSVCAAVMTGNSSIARSDSKLRLAQASEPRISVAPTIQAEPASQASLPIEVGPQSGLPPNSFVRLRGLPPSVSLTVGHAIAAGAWAVPLFGLPALKANVPAGVSGRTEIVISLVGVDGDLLAETRTTLVIIPGAGPAPPQKGTSFLTPPPPVPAGRPVGQAAPRVPELSAEDKARGERLLAQGERYLEQGNIALAREFFRRASDVGFAQGAIRLATTYDPTELARLHTQGVIPDRAEARKWYERAKELGAPDVEERLARLGGS